MTVSVVNSYSGSWSVPDQFVNTQPANQSLAVSITIPTGGNWLVAAVAWHEVPLLPTSVSVGDSAANLWTPVVTSPTTATYRPLNGNINFTSGAFGWGCQNGTLTSSTSQAYVGTHSVKITPNGTSSKVQFGTGANLAVSPNAWYTSSFYVLAPAGYSYLQAGIQWYTGGGTFITTSLGNLTDVPANTWTQITVAAQSPSGAGQGNPVVIMLNRPDAWDFLFVGQGTLTASQGLSSVTRCTLWVAPNVSSSTSLVVIAPLGQVTAMTANVLELAGMPKWLTVDTTASSTFDNSAVTSLTVTPSQNSLVLACGSTSVANGWTLDRLLQSWNPTRYYVSTSNQTVNEGDEFGLVTWQTSSVATPAQFYSVNPLNANPVFKTSTTTWTVSNATLALSGGLFWPDNSYNATLASTNSAKVTPNGTSSAINLITVAANAPAITVGNPYLGEAYVYVPGGWGNCTVALGWLNGSRTLFSSTVGVNYVVASNVWTNLTVIGTAPSGAAFAELFVQMNHTPPSSTVMYVGKGTITPANNNGVGIAAVEAAIQLTPTPPAQPNANWPPVKLEVAFGQGAGTLPDQLVYTDISNRVLSFTTKRGRQYELNSLETGEVDFVLRNDDGFLTPGNTASGGYQVQVYNPMRLTATWNQREYAVFVGYMERWPQTWTDAHWGEVNAKGVDAQAMLTALMSSIVNNEILLDQPVGYWPCADGNSSTTAVNVGYGLNQTPLVVKKSVNGAGSGSYAFGDNSLQLVGDTATNWVITGLTSSQTSMGYALVYSGPQLPPLNSGVTVYFRVGFVNTGPISFAGNHLAIFTMVGRSNPILEIWADNSGDIHVSTWNVNTGVRTDHTPASGSFFGANADFFLTLTNTGYTLRLNGISTLTGTDTLDTLWFNFELGGRLDPFTTGSEFGNIAFSHVAVFPRIIGFSRFVTYHFSGYNGMAADVADHRVSRELSYTQWTVPHRVGFELGSNTLSGATNIQGQDIATGLDNIAKTTAALLYVDRTGYLVYLPRFAIVNPRRGSQGTLGENTAAGEVPYLVTLEIDYDPQYVQNDIQVTHLGTPAFGVTKTNSSPIIYAKNSASIQQYGDHPLQVTSLFNDVAQSVDLSQWYLHQYAQPQLRVAQVEVQPSRRPTDFAKVLQWDVGDMIVLNRRPVGAPQISLNVLVIGVHHDVNWKEGTWTSRYDLMPLSVASLAGNTLTLNDAVLGLLDNTNVIGW